MNIPRNEIHEKYMSDFINKRGAHSFDIYRGWQILEDCKDEGREVHVDELENLGHAAETIVILLSGRHGLTYYENEVLLGFARYITDKTKQLPFLDHVVNIIKASRTLEQLTNFDIDFMEEIEWIHKGLDPQGASEYLNPELVGDNSMQQFDNQLFPFLGDMSQTPSGDFNQNMGINPTGADNIQFTPHTAPFEMPQVTGTNADFECPQISPMVESFLGLFYEEFCGSDSNFDRMAVANEWWEQFDNTA
ncbi:hypothetical protein F53441_7224 [Fusarium austroafricanum]|uniref:Uncharacterized protein n=1 Tax=Fusarium austroafricanum TaxID=2364996 RepID=A0A8H4NSG5_9HYPO|nr:hypothetical protein F53441_7224 [Fusarium austroafricanum]